MFEPPVLPSIRVPDGLIVPANRARDTFLASLRRLSEKELVSCGHAGTLVTLLTRGMAITHKQMVIRFPKIPHVQYA